jgi:pimeloyl-ACP methyl ester carboxylesterase/predicted glycosyltransferase
MRARLPDREGYVESRGTRIYWEEHGAGERTVMLIPPWQIVHSRIYKMQLPYLARHFRVITFDPPGNGRSDRPARGYDHGTTVAHALAVLDATGTPRASLLCKSRSAWHGVILAADHPDRVERLVLVAPALADAPRGGPDFHTARATYDGWQKYNAHYWREHFEEFLEFFFDECFPEPHSTKPREDGVAWGRGTTPDILIATIDESPYHESLATLLPRIHVPTLIIHGDADRIRPLALAERAHAAIAGSTLAVFEGTGHGPGARQPVRTNLLLRDFFRGGEAPARRTWRRALARPRRALFVSSPIGLGHAMRDVAIADALRAQRPDLDIHWLAQDPVTRVLEARGETIHPASRHLAGESAHIESEAGEHDLHVFQAWRSMDEILLANFMVLHDVLEAAPYDLVIGDEAWEADYYWHENPELKRTAYVWLTDFVGWVPLDGPGSREAALTADYNAEMIEHIARFPRVRDRAIFVGNVEDVVDLPFGPGLPNIREWTARHYAFPGYVLPFDPAQFADREALRARLGFHADERVVLAAVGGSGVGHHLLRRVLAAAPHVRRLCPDARLVVVAGPRIAPAALPAIPGVDVRPFVPDLYAYLAACDLAIVQGGLSTCMELTAAKRPFLYFPLRNHFEQQVHVPHRLGRYGAGVRMDYAETDPEALAHAVAEGLKRPVLYRDVEAGGARRAAELIAPLLGN